MTTQSELIELSTAAAKVAGIADFRFVNVSEDGKSTDMLWLHEDSARCFELMCRYLIGLEHFSNTIFVEGFGRVKLADHNNNREQAIRVAILKAIVAIG